MNKSLKQIFNKDQNIVIGALHFAPLFGYPDHPGIKVIVENALQDLEAFEKGGADGIIIENNYDVPHHISVMSEVTNMMIELGKEIKSKSTLPIGVSVLWNDYQSALFIAKTIGADFIRVPVFVDNVKTSYGVVRGNPQDVLTYRKKIGAENVALFTDIHVKHAELLDKKSLEQSAQEAIEHGSDALLITGRWTGEAPALEELKKLRSNVGNFPLIVSSGADTHNNKNLSTYCNGFLVSTSLKEGLDGADKVNVKTWKQRISKTKVREFVDQLKM